MTDRVYSKADFFCGAGGMVAGYSWARTEMLGVRGRFETVLALDADAKALASCERMNGVRVTLGDLFEHDAYVAYHADKRCWCRSKLTLAECHNSPPPEWVEMQPEDLRRLCPGGADVLAGSPPCKGFSRLTSGKRAESPKYQALNTLVVRWLWLWLNAFPDAPPRLIILENVPDIADPRRRRQRRGEALIARVEAMLAAYGYACRRTAYDCADIAGLAQHRDRFLLVGRHVATTQAPLLEPFKLPVRSIGDVIGGLPPPLGDTGIPMHVLPNNKRPTEERLAFVEPGRDWRSIEPNWQSAPGFRLLDVGDGVDVLLPAGEGGVLDPRLVKRAYGGIYGVREWDETLGTMTGRANPSTGAYSVADPRVEDCFGGGYGVNEWDDSAGTVTGSSGWASSGQSSVADPRLPPRENRHSSKYSIADWDKQARTITTTRGGPGAPGVADPRLTCTPTGATLRVVEMGATSPPIIGTSGVWSSGSVQIADPRVAKAPRNGAFGVQEWDGQAAAVTGSFDLHNAPAAVQAPPPRAGRVILAPDWRRWRERDEWVTSHWARSMTLRELASLQSFPLLDHQGRPLQLVGTLDEQRMQIGNAVPPEAARVIAELMLGTLLASDLGVSVTGGSGIWVREGGVLRWHATSRRQCEVSVEAAP